MGKCVQLRAPVSVTPMALARLVTRTPEYAQNLARSLEEAGYSVEFTSPDLVSHGTLVGMPQPPADLEVNLDDPAAASSYLVTAEGKEISFIYDVGEREFVLAPAWRKLKLAIAPLLESFKRANQPARNPEPMQTRETELTGAVPVVSPSIAERRQELAEAPTPTGGAPWDESLDPISDSAQTSGETPVYDSGMIAEDAQVAENQPSLASPVLESLYLPQQVAYSAEPDPGPVEFTSAEYFDGQGKRKTREPHISSRPPVEAELIAEDRMEAGQTVEPTAPASPRVPWLVTAALRAEAARTFLADRLRVRRETLSTAVSHLRGYDAAWLRATPVAALIAVAFLLGWSYANTQRPTTVIEKKPEASAMTSSAPVQEASLVPVRMATPASAPTSSSVTQSLASAPQSPATKRSPSRKVAADLSDDEEDTDTAGDVVIRHYPTTKDRRAIAQQKGTVKRYSDIE